MVLEAVERNFESACDSLAHLGKMCGAESCFALALIDMPIWSSSPVLEASRLNKNPNNHFFVIDLKIFRHKD